MKTVTKLIGLIFCIIILISENLVAQVKKDKININETIQNHKIPPKKLGKKDWIFNQKISKGGYALLETDIYSTYLKVQLAKLNKKKIALKVKTNSNNAKSDKSTSKIDKKIAYLTTQLKSTDLSSNNYPANESSDCPFFDDELCDKLKNAYQARMVEEFGPIERDCPDEHEHCFPIPFRQNIRYIILPYATKFKAILIDKKGRKEHVLGKPVLIEGIKKYVMYPIDIKNNRGEYNLMITKSVQKNKLIKYQVPIRIN